MPPVLHVEGYNPSGAAGDVTITLRYDNQGTSCEDVVKLTVYHVQTLIWATAAGSGNLPIEGDACENNGGIRIFPGKISPGDLQAATRWTVELVATIAPAVADLAGEAVYFKVWDVDDPFDQMNAGMPDVNLIDAAASGPDNRPPPGEGPTSLTGSIDPAGQEARVTFTVSMQPGNNYRAGASCLSDAVSEVQARQLRR